MSNNDTMGGGGKVDVSDWVVANREDGTELFTHRLVCHDGFSVSVQASRCHYSTPRENNEPRYFAFELGFPSEDMGVLINDYAEDKDEPLNTVYAYVPGELVQAVIDLHGGIKGRHFDEAVAGGDP
jgi:hypothetical protein